VKTVPRMRYNAVLWAVAGAGLFIGIGAALPVWGTRFTSTSAGPYGVETHVITLPLWDTVAGRISSGLWDWRLFGGYGPFAYLDAEAPRNVILLLRAGAGFGLLAHALREAIKPGGA
jgi:hypothetical protein